MATSVQACLPNCCKNQHQANTLTKSPKVVRRASIRQQNTVNRKSAVERLEESKANYVKSEQVLDTKQELKSCSHLHISSGPRLDINFKSPPKYGPEFLNISNGEDDTKLYHLQQQGVYSCMRQRTKSHSECRNEKLIRKPSFASQSRRHHVEVLVDIESQLKRLIVTGSKENIALTYKPVILGNAQSKEHQLSHCCKSNEFSKVCRGYSDPVRRSCWVSNNKKIELETEIHKSMPDLSPLPNCSQDISPLSIGLKTIIDSDHLFSKTQTSNCTSLSIDKSPKLFDPQQQPCPKRFSNGTGILHLTPYYSTSGHLQRKPVSRSKSDVSHRYSKRCTEYFSRCNNYTSTEIERFFDTMGLDTNAWHHISSPSSSSTPPCFFESVSSVDSNDEKSSVCSDDSLLIGHKGGIRNQDLRVHGPLETSIVEKNARVIKWLYNCRKATSM